MWSSEVPNVLWWYITGAKWTSEYRNQRSSFVICPSRFHQMKELGLKCQVFLCCLITKNVFRESKPVRLNMYFPKPEAAAAFEHLAATVFWEPLKRAYRDTLLHGHNGCLMLQSFVDWSCCWVWLMHQSFWTPLQLVMEMKYSTDFMEAVPLVFRSKIGPREISSRIAGQRFKMLSVGGCPQGNLMYFHPPDSVTFL